MLAVIFALTSAFKSSERWDPVTWKVYGFIAQPQDASDPAEVTSSQIGELITGSESTAGTHTLSSFEELCQPDDIFCLADVRFDETGAPVEVESTYPGEYLGQ